MSNHLGNVMAVINDKQVNVNGNIEPELISSNDYYAFGGQMNGRDFTNLGAQAYRYGFNGKENDNEVKGTGNQQDYGMRIYDPRIGKFLSVDPLMEDYPDLSTYQFAGNSPILNTDLDGLEPKNSNDNTQYNGSGKALLLTGQWKAIEEASKAQARRTAGKKILEEIGKEAFSPKWFARATGVGLFIELMLSPLDAGRGSDMSSKNLTLNEYQRLTNDPSKLTESDVKQVLDRINRSQATPQDLLYRRSILSQRYSKTFGLAQILDRAPDSKVLARNLIAEGFNRPDNVAAHHIVAGTDVRAAEARQILKREGIDINEAVNGVFLPSSSKYAVPPQAIHSKVHTDAYYEKVNTRLRDAKPGTVANELRAIGQELKKGTF